MSFLKTQADGSRVPFAEGGKLANVEVVSAAKTLVTEDSGKVFSLQAAEGVEIGLPATPVKGWNAKFIVGLAFATSAWTVVSPTKVIQGTVLVNGASVLGEDEDIITFAHAAENVGDWVELCFDGTNYLVSGVGSAASSITLTASA